MRCVVCGSTSFSNDEDLYVCNDCGTQSQAYRAEVAEADEGVAARTVTKDKRYRAHIRNEPEVEAAIQTTLTSLTDAEVFEGFQRILQHMVAAISGGVETGRASRLQASAKKVWMAYAQRFTVVLRQHYAEGFLTTIALRKRIYSQELQDKGAALCAALIPSMHLLLALLNIAMAALRMPVFLGELLQAAQGGQLPWLNAIDCLPSHIRDKPAAQLLFLPRRRPVLHTIRTLATKICAFVSYKPPQPDHPLLAASLVQHLGLPTAVLALTLELLPRCPPAVPVSHYVGEVMLPDWAPHHAVGLLGVALKILYGFDEEAVAKAKWKASCEKEQPEEQQPKEVSSPALPELPSYFEMTRYLRDLVGRLGTDPWGFRPSLWCENSSLLSDIPSSSKLSTVRNVPKR